MKRSGFTLAEVVVALLLLSVGVGAVAATAAAWAGLVRESRHMEAGAWAAWRLIEGLRAEGCPRAGGGSEAGGGRELEWAVWNATGSGARRIQVVVRPSSGRSGVASSFGTAVEC
jgi:prepilin-type N-terminal cleavage/methylation domain-containing protein